MEGKGKYIFRDGKIYEGKWKDNKMNDFGTFKWPDGKIYEGQFKDDKKDGFGTLIWPDKSKYVGNWKNGKQFGLGKYASYEGHIIEGYWNGSHLNSDVDDE